MLTGVLTVEQCEPHEWVFRNPASIAALEREFDGALDALDAGAAQRAEAELRELHSRCPWHLDIIHHLGLVYEKSGRNLEARLCAQEGARLGLAALPKDFSWHLDYIRWTSYANRPFLRVYHCFGLWHLRFGEMRQAMEIFSRLLSVNPSDNQGARYLLAHCFLATSAWNAAVHFMSSYPDDPCPEISYSRALALIASGNEAEATAALIDAVDALPLVAKELLKARHREPVSQYAGGITHGGADQAFEYWKWNGDLWRKNKAAMELLRNIVKGK